MKPLTVLKPKFLLDYLFETLSDRPKTEVKRLLQHGSVRVNGEVVTHHKHLLAPGDEIELLGRGAAALERFRKHLPFRVVHEDEVLLVVEKPAGLLTMGTDREKEKTLYWKLTEYVRAQSKDGRGRVFIVHRLDRDTSGLVVFAKNERAKRYLQFNWEKTAKDYAAVVEGLPVPKQGTLQSWLVEDGLRVYPAEGPGDGAKKAVTRYRVLKAGARSLVELTLETGRKHQIRVQLAEAGWPVAGDAVYGGGEAERLMLHAARLSFPHPITEQTLRFESPLPEEFTRLAR